MLIDDVTVTIRSGHGGRGKKAFNKNANSLGPVGGSGGNGGNVYVEGTSDLSALSQFRYKKEVSAEDGENGGDQFRDGANGEDLVLKIPVGTVLHDAKTGTATEVLKIGERALIAKGGNGGKGNFLFRSPRNTSPMQIQEGLPGEEHIVRLELKLIADVGFVGLPNAGKSSLLNALTRAQSRVANYPFTTLEPNLGVYFELILADIPGLIEGAASGKGLGTKFLRHVERTGTLFHLISAESETPREDYDVIRKELETYNPQLIEKPTYLFLTKKDLLSASELKKKLAVLKKCDDSAKAISIHEPESIKKVEVILRKLIKEKMSKS